MLIIVFFSRLVSVWADTLELYLLGWKYQPGILLCDLAIPRHFLYQWSADSGTE